MTSSWGSRSEVPPFCPPPAAPTLGFFRGAACQTPGPSVSIYERCPGPAVPGSPVPMFRAVALLGGRGLSEDFARGLSPWAGRTLSSKVFCL